MTTTHTAVPLVLTIKDGVDYHAGNRARLNILLRSLDRFAAPGEFQDILILTPDDELAGLTEHLRCSPTAAGRRAQAAGDDSILPGISAHPAHPWFKQQALKLAAHARWPGSFYMTMDADIFATKPFSMSDFIVQGRALLDTETREHQWRWWQAAASILDMDTALIPPAVMTVTPCLYHATVMAAVLAEIERLHGRTWHEALLGPLTAHEWAEHALYFAGAIKLGLLDRYHVLGPAPQDWRLHALNAVYMSEVWPAWDVAACFSGWSGVFTCIASSARIPVEDLEAKIAPYIP